MARYSFYICITSFLLLTSSCQEDNEDSLQIIPLMKNIGSVASIAFKAAQFLWKAIDTSGILKQHSSTDRVKMPFTGPSPHSQIMSQLKQLSAKSDRLQVEMRTMRDVLLDKLTMDIPGLQDLNHHMSKIFINCMSVSKTYDDFVEYLSSGKKYDKKLLVAFAKKSVSDGSCGVSNLLGEINALLVRSDANLNPVNALTLLVKHAELFLDYTKAEKSPQKLLYDLLNSVIFNEVKGYLALRFSYSVLDQFEGGQYEFNIEKAEREFGRRVNGTIDAFKDALPLMSREFSTRDPNSHLEDETFTELKQVFQTVMIDERDIDPRNHCYNLCYQYPEPKQERNCHKDKPFCTKQRRCQGKLHNCDYKVPNNVQVCLADPSSSRRYEYIVDGNGDIYGNKKKECATELLTGQQIYHTWTNMVFCDICTCTCAEASMQSESFINLTPILSRTEDNYIITGARLVKKSRILHIQIQEGKLLPNGVIDENTVTWAPIQLSTPEILTLTWAEVQEINLDDLIAPDNHVIVGLSFIRKNISDHHARVHLEIVSKPIDFLNGTIYNDQNITLSNEPSNHEIDLSDLNIPTNVEGKSLTRSQSGQYLKFVPSGLKVDAGQSTIPFIDIQNLTTIPAAPLSGFGLYHRYRETSGGFLALKLFTYNFAPHLDANLPK